ncbi:DUF4864 domain-containing protein [Marinobacter salinisoli]|uniref:DUF4864 domain-containing protein n=1 Tax=Marinobacter salinisoli TaxID=2769486 RepID=A0ABX7MVR0_9GAMM|nr:DUF4864 domain-containing protein [Marinobacter salinisoli]QSP95582.1 DUF4864 domain-containing protein [Marinobacter salinisoli]
MQTTRAAPRVWSVLPFLIVSTWTLLPTLLHAEDEIDVAIRDAIMRQIEAFANDDEETAWTYASEGIKRQFGSSDVFVDMVREQYPAVHRASTIEFAERIPHGPFEIQTVKIRGPEGGRWDAFYRMVRIRGEWRIAGVRLAPSDPGI